MDFPRDKLGIDGSQGENALLLAQTQSELVFVAVRSVARVEVVENRVVARGRAVQVRVRQAQKTVRVAVPRALLSARSQDSDGELRDHAEGGGNRGTGSAVVANQRRGILVETAFGTEERRGKEGSTCCHLRRLSRRRRECCWYGNSTWTKNKHSGQDICYCRNLYVTERKSACLQNKEMRYSRLGKMLNYYQESIHHCTIEVIRNMLKYVTTR